MTFNQAFEQMQLALAALMEELSAGMSRNWLVIIFFVVSACLVAVTPFVLVPLVPLWIVAGVLMRKRYNRQRHHRTVTTLEAELKTWEIWDPLAEWEATQTKQQITPPRGRSGTKPPKQNIVPALMGFHQPIGKVDTANPPQGGGGVYRPVGKSVDLEHVYPPQQPSAVTAPMIPTFTGNGCPYCGSDQTVRFHARSREDILVCKDCRRDRQPKRLKIHDYPPRPIHPSTCPCDTCIKEMLDRLSRASVTAQQKIPCPSCKNTYVFTLPLNTHICLKCRMKWDDTKSDPNC